MIRRHAPAAAPALPSRAAAGTTLTDIYPRAWAYWAAAVIASFAAIELAALRHAPGHGTLTAQLRRNRRLSAAAIAAFGCWAVHHVAREGVDAISGQPAPDKAVNPQ
jgi:fatty acid desaturase